MRAPVGADKMTPQQILDRMDAAVLALNGEGSRNWTQAYIDSGADTKPLTQRLALLACRMGNDPHNQEIGQVLLEDWAKNQSARPRPAAGGLRAPHRGAPQIRQPARLRQPLRRRPRDRAAAVGEERFRTRLLRCARNDSRKCHCEDPRA